MSNPHRSEFSEAFTKAVLLVAEHDKGLQAMLDEGPEAIGRLQFQLQVTPQDYQRTAVRHAEAIAGALKTGNNKAIREASAAYVRDMNHLKDRAAAHALALQELPPAYRPARS